MIFRRVKAHIEKENWFAVGVDFFIVVAGILIAFQITSWSDTSRANAKEAIILEQLQAEFAITLAGMRKAEANAEIALKATRDVLKVIRQDIEPEDKAAFLRTLGNAGSFESGPAEPTTLVELTSSGGLSELSFPDLRTALIRYHEAADQQGKLADLTLARVSTPDDGFHDAIYINPDYSSPEDLFLDKYDWSQIAETRQQFQVILYGKLGLKDGIEEQIVRGETVLAELEKALK